MVRVNELHNIVFEILENDIDVRNNDMHLIERVFSEKIDTNLSFRNIVSNRKDYDLPSFESITRIRRKIQEQFPQLKSNEKVQKYRDEMYCEHKCYSLGIQYEEEREKEFRCN